MSTLDAHYMALMHAGCIFCPTHLRVCVRVLALYAPALQPRRGFRALAKGPQTLKSKNLPSSWLSSSDGPAESVIEGFR
jgi:hypothetical protein